MANVRQNIILDDIFGVAILLLLHPFATLIRTRDQAVTAAADFAVDVGGVWDAEKGRFDHHQKGFDVKRGNGVTYASAGLVWAAHGLPYIRHMGGLSVSEAHILRVHEAIDQELVQHLDQADTGEAQGAPGYFGLSALLASFNPTRDEVELWSTGSPDKGGATAARTEAMTADMAHGMHEAFIRATKVVTTLLRRLVLNFVSDYAGEELVRNAERLDDGRILVLGNSGLTWDRIVVHEMPEVLFVIYPDSTDNQYQVRTVPVAMQSFEARKDLPVPWAGLRDAELAKVSGVSDAVFCHNGRFIGGAVSKEGALALARLALAA